MHVYCQDAHPTMTDALSSAKDHMILARTNQADRHTPDHLYLLRRGCRCHSHPGFGFRGVWSGAARGVTFCPRKPRRLARVTGGTAWALCPLGGPVVGGTSCLSVSWHAGFSSCETHKRWTAAAWDSRTHTSARLTPRQHKVLATLFVPARRWSLALALVGVSTTSIGVDPSPSELLCP
ncbi:hypothetical protein J2Z31_005963 [Sinorhizobium kostiense]|uniref:Uncharacterized protein n=1 Tax=Sinorhizobium kostiense TaxID=76747 RepID=A0ABS4R940_9HYPH|nr:hypothetical protein [Sinorhizobium kostiense]